MKKSLLLLVCLVTFVSLFSQEESTFNYPVKGDKLYMVSIGSYDASIIDNNFRTVEGTASLNSFGVSFNYENYLSKNWSFKTGVVIDPKGFQSPLGISKLRMQYLTAPFLMSWHFGKKRRWYLHFGAYAGYLLSVKDKDINGNSSPLDLRGNFNSWDIGLDIGIGIRIPIGSHMFFVETDGQTGLTNPARDPDENRYLTRNTLSLGYIF